MGTFGRILGNLADTAHQRADQMRAQAESSRQSQIELYKPILSNPNASPEQRQYATEQLNKLMQLPKGKSPLDALTGFVNKVHGHMAANGAPAAVVPPFGGGNAPVVAAPGNVAPAAAGSPQPVSSTQTASASPSPLPTLGGDLSIPSFDSSTATQSAKASLPPLAEGAPNGAQAAPIASPTTATPAAHEGIGSRALGIAAKGLSGLGSIVHSFTEPSYLPPTVQLDAKDIPLPPLTAPKWDRGEVQAKDVEPGAKDFLTGEDIDPESSTHYISGLQNGRRVYRSITSAVSGRPLQVGLISASDAVRRARDGEEEFPGIDGKKIDPFSLSPSEALRGVDVAGQMRYVRVTPGQRTIKVGNQVYAVNPEDIMGAPGYASSLGVANPGSTGSTPRTFVDQNTGQTTIVNLPTTRTVAAPGMNGARGLPPISGIPASAPTNTPAGLPGNPASTPTPSPSTPTLRHRAIAPTQPSTQPAPTAPTPRQTSATTSSAGGRVLTNLITPGLVNSTRQRNTAINGAIQSVNNLTKPHGPAQQSYMDMFRDPAALDRVSNYIKLNNAIMEKEFEQKVGGGLVDAAQFYAGVPQSILGQQNEEVKRAYAKLTPQDQQNAATYYNLVGNFGGVRKATGANASQWAFQNLQSELPSPLTTKSYEGAKALLERNKTEIRQYQKPNLTIESLDDDKPSQSAPRVLSTGHKVGDPVTVRGKQYTITKVYKDGTFDAK